MSDRKRKDWRELCAAVSNEHDSTKLGLLIQELIEALDDQHENRVSMQSLAAATTKRRTLLC
jgi:hypothetical protein